MGKKRRINRYRDVFVIAVSLFFLALFTVSVFGKFSDPGYLAYTIRNYPFYKFVLQALFSDQFLAYTILAAETIVILLFLFYRLRFTLIAAVVLLSLYAGNLLSLIIENNYFDCGCGLFYLSEDPASMLMADLLFILAGLTAIQFTDPKNSRSLWGWLFGFRSLQINNPPG